MQNGKRNIRLSIVVVAFRARRHLKQTIASINDNEAWEVIVVDNTHDNVGFGKGCNSLVKKARGKFVLFLNPDTKLKPQAIQLLVEQLEQDDTIGIIGPQLLDANGQAYLSTTKQPTKRSAPIVYSFLNRVLKNSKTVTKYWYKDYPLNETREVESISGAAMMVRKNEFESLGGFDESMFMYWEDYELCWRVRDSGKKVWFYPKARVIHYGEKSTESKLLQTKLRFRSSRWHYFRKRFGWVYATALESLLILQEEWRLLVITAIAALLRFYRLGELMPLLGDQAYELLEAVKILETGKLPLLGIHSSMPRFQQGPLHIWMLGLLFSQFGIQAQTAGYFAASVGVAIVVGSYGLAEKIWGRTVAVVTGLLLATSPLVVAQARMPFIINPLPLFSLFYLFSLQRSYRKPIDYFWVTLTFGLLFQFELAVFPVAILSVYYLFRYRKRIVWWGKTIGYGLLGLILGLLPQIIYDIKHGFTQLSMFLVWVVYRIIGFVGFSNEHRISYQGLGEVLGRFQEYLSKYVSWGIYTSWMLAGLVVLVAIVLYWRQLRRGKQDFIAVVLGWVVVVGIGFVVHGGPSEAYFPVLFVPLGLLTGWVVWKIHPPWRMVAMVLVVLLSLYNVWFMIHHEFVMSTPNNRRKGVISNYGPPLSTQEQVVKLIMRVADGKPVDLVALGPGSEHEKYLDNYRFLFRSYDYPLSDMGVRVIFLLDQRDALGGTIYKLSGVRLTVETD